METSHPINADNRAFAVEQHGIDYIPESSRNATAREIFFTWFGANVIFTYVVLGAIVGSLGLDLWESLTVVVLGNLLYVLVGLTSIAGPRAGTATLTASRAAFGTRGNKAPSLLSWLTTIGWTTVNMVIGTLSLVAVADLVGMSADTGIKIAALAIITLVTVAITVLGHATILLINTILSYALGLGTLVLGVLVVLEANDAGITTGDGGGLAAWLIGIAVIGSAPMSYVNTGADYSRYMPSGSSARSITTATALGSAIPATLIASIGVVAAAVTDMTDAIAGLEDIVPSAMLIIYLTIVVGGTITNNFLNTYSSGMSLLAVGVSMSRARATLLNIAIALAVTCYVVFYRDFSEFLVAFLSLMIVWSSSWCGVFLADMLLRQSKYDVKGLHVSGVGPYWYRSGWNVSATLWFVMGVVASALFATSTIWTGPLAEQIGGGDLSIFAGLLVGGGGYYVHARLGRRGSYDGEAASASTAADFVK